MPIYVAMLRGINVGRGKVVKMARLRASLESLGFDGVRMYVQSGNVVFESEQKSAAELSKKIETKILRDFGFAVPVILKRSKEIEQIVRDNPLVKEKGIDHSKLHVTFLSDAPPTAALKALEPLATSRERFRVLNRAPITKFRAYYPESVYLSTVIKNLETAEPLRAYTNSPS